MFTSQKNVHTHAHMYTCVRIHNIHTHTDAVTYCWPVIPNVHLLREQLLLVQLVRRQKQIYRTSSFTIYNFANLHSVFVFVFCLCLQILSLSLYSAFVFAFCLCLYPYRLLTPVEPRVTLGFNVWILAEIGATQSVEDWWHTECWRLVTLSEEQILRHMQI